LGKFNNIDKYSNVDISEYIKNIPQQIQSSGLKLDSNNNYDIENRKLTNVADGTDPNVAVTKNQLDTATVNKHDNNINLILRILSMSSTANSKCSMK